MRSYGAAFSMSTLNALSAEQIAAVVWAALFCIFYSERLIYLAVCLGLGLIGGHTILEYAPAIFLPIEFIISVVRIFKRAGSMRF